MEQNNNPLQQAFVGQYTKNITTEVAKDHAKTKHSLNEAFYKAPVFIAKQISNDLQKRINIQNISSQTSEKQQFVRAAINREQQKLREQMQLSQSLPSPDINNKPVVSWKQTSIDNNKDNAVQQNNIFNQEEFIRYLPRHQIGPRFEKESLVKYSVVGCNEFLKYRAQMQNRRHLERSKTAAFAFQLQRQRHPTTKITIKHQKSIPIVASRINVSQASGFESQASQLQQSQLKIDKSTRLERNQDNSNNFLKEVSIQEMEGQIRAVLTRQDENRIQDQKTIATLSKNEQRFFTKEYRIINNFNEQQNYWDQKITRVSKLANKQPEKSVAVVSSEDFRKKWERNKTLDLIQTDTDKYGPNKFWIKQLRSDRNDKQLQQQYDQKFGNFKEYYDAFRGAWVLNDFEAHQVEMVRSQRGLLKNTVPLQNFSSRAQSNQKWGTHNYNNTQNGKKFVDLKINQYKGMYDLMMPCKEDQICGLQVEGNNKLRQEIKYVKSLIQKQQPFDTFYKYRKDVPQEEQNPIVYVSQYDKLDLMNKTGSTMLPQIQFNYD